MKRIVGNDINTQRLPHIIKAALSSYILMMGIPLGVFIFSLVVSFAKHPKGSVTACMLMLGFILGHIVWLRGFSLLIFPDKIVYRNGLYRTTSIDLQYLRRVRCAWTTWTNLGRVFRSASVVLDYVINNKKSKLIINAQVFQKTDIDRFVSIVEQMINAEKNTREV